ncbi:MAG: helix-turn-helix domain-containing protein, partial [Chloroflexi bacterium]|nr:helix-turn-helix domain-containing protein [Chloroflexota bacterium]
MATNRYSGSDVKKLRDELGISRSTLAEKLGVTYHTVRNW